MRFDLSRRGLLGLLAAPGAAAALQRLTGSARAQDAPHGGHAEAGYNSARHNNPAAPSGLGSDGT